MLGMSPFANSLLMRFRKFATSVYRQEYKPATRTIPATQRKISPGMRTDTRI